MKLDRKVSDQDMAQAERTEAVHKHFTGVCMQLDKALGKAVADREQARLLPPLCT